MSAGEAIIAQPQRPRVRVRAKALVGIVLLAALWGCFFSWCLLVMRGPALVEAWRALTWLATVLSAYLAATVMWIAFNALLYLLRGPARVEAATESAFEKDYFGRPLAVATGAAFSDQYLVLEYKDGKKIYRVPDADESLEPAVAGDLRSLAAAAGESVVPARQAAEEGEMEKKAPYARHI